ncbi:MAG: hypothetical protein AB1894_16450 [Chloroflexota bacterium]
MVTSKETRRGVSLAPLRARLPSRCELAPVFAILLFLDFSWSLYHMFFVVPSWLYYMNVWGVLGLTTYVLAFSLLESALILASIVLLCLLFPPHLFREQFIALGSATAGVIGLGAVLVQRSIGLIYDMRIWQLLAFPPAILVGLVLLIWLMGLVLRRVPLLARLLSALAERMQVFIWVYLPLGVIGIVVVIIRNLFWI